MDILERLFDSPVRAKLLKLFSMNPDSQFSSAEAEKLVRVRPAQFAAEVRRLLKLHILKSGTVRMAIGRLEKRGRRPSRPRLAKNRVFSANKDFPLFAELRMLMLKSAPHAKGQLAGKIKRLGAVKLAILAGVFIDQPSSRLDFLLVGDGLKKARLKSFLQWLEAEVGKEMNYVVMSTQEFKYRRDMFDRFLRDVLESPHETVVNKLGV